MVSMKNNTLSATVIGLKKRPEKAAPEAIGRQAVCRETWVHHLIAGKLPHMADVIKKTFLQAIRLERDKISNFKPYPFCIPAVRHLHRLEFHPAVTFFIGENGTGKSTLMEATATKYRIQCGRWEQELQLCNAGHPFGPARLFPREVSGLFSHDLTVLPEV
jgi:hypothetical protein